MTFFAAHTWQIAVGSALILAVSVVVLWLVFRKRPTPEELERARRLFLSQTGRLVDGMLLDICEIEATAKSPTRSKPAPTPHTLTMLMYSYHIGGVDYECAQDITTLRDVVNTAQIRAGFPCSARYQPGNAQNSIVVSEEWTGLRMGLPVLPVYDDPEPVDISHLRPGRG